MAGEQGGEGGRRKEGGGRKEGRKEGALKNQTTWEGSQTRTNGRGTTWKWGLGEGWGQGPASAGLPSVIVKAAGDRCRPSRPLTQP